MPDPERLTLNHMHPDSAPACHDLQTWSSTRDLADWLHIPEPTIHQWRSRGTAPAAHRIGRHLRFHRDDIAAWLADRADPRPVQREPAAPPARLQT